MNLPGIVTVLPEQNELINTLADMMGESFLEEMWTIELLSVIDGADASQRRLELSRAIMREEFALGAPLQCCYALEDRCACAGAYLKSDLGERTWESIEEQAFRNFAKHALSEREAALLDAQASRMESISSTSWEEDVARELKASDFIHFYLLGVDKTRRGSGAFRRLVTPFFDYADAHGIPCFLETYSDKLESLYAHFGFETIREYRSPEFEVYERCMMRRPQ